MDTFDQKNIPFIMEIGLWFYDSYKKDSSQSKNYKTESKEVRKVKFMINPFINAESIHEFVPVLF